MRDQLGQTALAATEPAAHALRLAPPVAGLSFRGPQMINRGLSFRLRVLRQVHRELVEQVELFRQKLRRAKRRWQHPSSCAPGNTQPPLSFAKPRCTSFCDFHSFVSSAFISRTARTSPLFGSRVGYAPLLSAFSISGNCIEPLAHLPNLLEDLTSIRAEWRLLRRHEQFR